MGQKKSRKNNEEEHIGKLIKNNPKVKDAYSLYTWSCLDHKSKENIVKADNSTHNLAIRGK